MIEFIENILPYVPLALGVSLGGALVYLFFPLVFRGKPEKAPQKVSQHSAATVTMAEKINWGG